MLPCLCKLSSASEIQFHYIYIDYSLVYVREWRLDWNKYWGCDELYELAKFLDNMKTKIYVCILEWDKVKICDPKF